MPQSSRRKKEKPNKRIEITDDDGWTRITSSHTLKSKPTAPKHPPPSREVVEPYADTTDYTLPEQKPDPDLTLGKITKQYRNIEKKWLASESWTSLKKALLEKAHHTLSGITTCVLFGSGSFSSRPNGWINRFDVAHYQLAAFKAVVDLLVETMRRDDQQQLLPKCYAQEILYTKLDGEFLASLGIEMVNDPGGFKLIGPMSFVFAPGAEMHVELRSIFHDPVLFLGCKQDYYWRDDKGRPRTDRIARYDDQGNRIVDEGEEDGNDNGRSESRISEAEANCRVVEKFNSGRQSCRIVDLDAKDFPIHATYLYWRTVEEREGEGLNGG